MSSFIDAVVPCRYDYYVHRLSRNFHHLLRLITFITFNPPGGLASWW